MTLTINLSPAIIEKLQVQAAASGKDVETFVREAVEVKLAISGQSFRDIMAPVHAEFDGIGMTETALDSLIDESVKDARATRKTTTSLP